MNEIKDSFENNDGNALDAGTQESQSIGWYIWAIKSGSIKKVKKFITEDVPEILDIVYPQVRKEVKTEKKVYIKTVPLYMNYLFVQLKDSDYEIVFNKFKTFAKVTTSLGRCSDSDLELINKVKKIEEKRASMTSFFKGDKVMVIGGPLKGHYGVVSKIRGNSVQIIIQIFRQDTITDVDSNLLDLVQDV